MDVSAQATMKDAAKCDKRCEWQNSANQENAERILHFQDTPESMFESGRLYFSVTRNMVFALSIWYTFVCVSDVQSVDASNSVKRDLASTGLRMVFLFMTRGLCGRLRFYILFLFTHDFRQGYPLNLSI